MGYITCLRRDGECGKEYRTEAQRMKTRLYYSFVVGTAIALSNIRPTAQAQNQPAVAAVTITNVPTPAALESTAKASWEGSKQQTNK